MPLVTPRKTRCHPAAAQRVELAGHRAVLVGQEDHERCDRLGEQFVCDRAEQVFGHSLVLATGAMALTLMLFLAPSTASTRLRPTSPILAAP